MATIHREKKVTVEDIDGICTDCKDVYNCIIRENAEARGNIVIECSRFKEDG